VTGRVAFGQSLRRQREKRGIPLEAVASAMKVSPSLLAGLERGDCSRWPGGIYSRACVREYAKAIGFDPSEVAARFAEHFPDTAHPAGIPEDAPVTRRVADPGQEPLRLTLATDAADRADALLHRARLVVVDLALVLAVAAGVSTALGKGFLVALAAASFACYAIAILRGAPPAASLVGAPLRNSAVPQPQDREPHTESVAAEAT
jgi:transcriptional regulator with XRE-family HTH domain